MSLQFIFTEHSFCIDEPEESLTEKEQNLYDAFHSDKYKALFDIGPQAAEKGESPSLDFLRQISERFFALLTSMPELELMREAARVELSDDTADELLSAVPYGIGTEYIDREWLAGIFAELNGVFSREMSGFKGTVGLFLAEKSQQLRVPERIFFHLVESKDEDYPFAFLATYATTDSGGQIRHMPLSYALTEFKTDREKLITLLSCLNKVSEVSPLLGGFVESGEMFHPLRLSAEEAYEFLKSVPEIEKCGVMCRVPNWWRKRQSAVSLSVKLGEKKASLLGFDTIVSMLPQLTVNGEALTKREIELLLKQTEGLAFLKGKWVEVDHARLRDLLSEMDKYNGDLTLLQAMRMGSGAGGEIDIDNGVKLTNGKWLSEVLRNLRQPGGIKSVKLPAGVNAVLRPYQQTGFNWLNMMKSTGFGACLADDMGLGKTLQILAFLEKLRTSNKDAKVLLIVPASLLGNWENEARKFTPKIEYNILHGKSKEQLEEELAGNTFLNITTYGMAARNEAFADTVWDCLILDEAQAIKNPVTKQTRAIKKIPAKLKIAMTGTPIENDLTNLWSLFDFLNKGLLGTSAEFKEFSKSLSDDRQGYQKLKGMVSPFILRRVKTDKNVIADLPDKLEQVEYITLSKKQTVLYRKQVAELERTLSDERSKMQRRGAVLAAILKLKQICNHPDQFLGQTAFDPADSGKFAMLKEICETVCEKRERVLVFTQYREITEFLAAYLEKIFRRRGLVIHGGVPAKKRSKLVEEFNGEAYVPFMVLSVKAGGTGLNLTAANHVIHFDRWWNPAVEDQATDRAFRIGQKKNVLVHKLVSKGTVEEKIDTLINSKRELAHSVIGAGGENWITEMSDRELIKLLRLE